MRKQMPLLDKHVEQELEDLFFSRWIEKATPIIEKECERLVEDKIQAYFNKKLSVREVANLTHRTEEAIYKLCERGILPFTKVRNRIQIEFDDIRSVLKSSDMPVDR